MTASHSTAVITGSSQQLPSPIIGASFDPTTFTTTTTTTTAAATAATTTSTPAPPISGASGGHDHADSTIETRVKSINNLIFDPDHGDDSGDTTDDITLHPLLDNVLKTNLTQAVGKTTGTGLLLSPTIIQRQSQSRSQTQSQTQSQPQSQSPSQSPSHPQPATRVEPIALTTSVSDTAIARSGGTSRFSRRLSSASRHIDTARSNNLGVLPNPSPVTPANDEFPHAITLRKASPGLAARFKALGFGAVKKTVVSVAPPLDAIGRLDEEQLRQLDEKHQAGSISAVISRRGRPWKGAGGFPGFHKSATHPDLDLTPASPERPDTTGPSEPLAIDMDTNKYRLPDHVNGNGTKATLETRREHLERVSKPFLTSPRQQRQQQQQQQQQQPQQQKQQPPPADAPPSPSPSPTPSPLLAPFEIPAAPPSAPPAAAAAAAIAMTTSPIEVVTELNSFFSPGHSRPGSVYTLSRASFANQIAQLTSLQLPDAESLSSKISAIPTAQIAANALINAAEQIRSWIAKAQEVIGGLDSEDDVEWAAAGGREGLEEVENAIARFQGLINVYVGSIDELQKRPDVSNVTVDDLTNAVSQMEAIVREWVTIKGTLQNVRLQVEIAMEWEELWNNVLGDIQSEMKELSRLVFEMEERRHQSLAVVASGDGLDINDLETIVEDSPTANSRLQASNRLSIAMPLMTSSSPGPPSLSQDDSNLLALFARMQPLRASLDFLPMRMSGFVMRAEQSFPTACEELEMRRINLDADYKKLEKDAESLRKELGEDRWVIVFRGAGRQAQKMHESVERSLLKLKDAVDKGVHLTNPPSIAKKVGSYESRKTHYGPAIERVLSIIEKGVQDRLTVNGEILRLHNELQSRWMSLKTQIREMDLVLEDISVDTKGQQLRDSVSTMVSMDHSNHDSPRETPSSSPPSSVIMGGLAFEPQTPISRQSLAMSPNSTGLRSLRRTRSSLPAPVTKMRSTASRLSTIYSGRDAPSSPVPPPFRPESSIADRPRRPESSLADRPRRPESSLANRPRWNSSTNTSDLDKGASSYTPPVSAVGPKTTQRSFSATTPSSTASKLPTLRNSFSRSTVESPRVSERSPHRGSSRLSFRERLTSPGPSSHHRQTSSLSQSRPILHPPSLSLEEDVSGRPGSPYGLSRRTSMMPQTLKVKKEANRATSPLPRISSRFSSRKYSNSQSSESKEAASKEQKPKWRF